MLINFFGNTNTYYFYDAFYDPADLGVDLTINSWSSTQIVGTNDHSGFVTTFTGTGFSDPDVTFTGTMTGFTTTTGGGAPVATVSGFSWDFASFVQAMVDLLENDDDTALRALLELQDITYDASTANEHIDDSYSGLNSAITFFGTTFNDSFEGGNRSDRLEGRNGNDTLAGNGGWDKLFGGSGRDSMTGGAGNDTLNGGGGNDDLSGDGGNDKLFGGSGFDVLSGAAGNDTLDGGGGNDTLLDGAGNDVVRGGAGNDTFFNEGGTDAFYGGGGRDLLITDTSGLAQDTLRFDALAGEHGRLGSTVGQDLIDSIEDFTLIGDWHAQVIGNGANNRFVTSSGNDTINAGGGADTISDGAGDDIIRGGGGNDLILASTGQDTYIGNAGSDTVAFDLTGSSNPQAFTVEINLTTGDGGAVGVAANRDTYTSIENITFDGNFDVILTGNGSANRLDTSAGNDTLEGGGGNDILRAGGGNDTLKGAFGNDRLFGEAGRDLMRGGAGNDTLEGGGGVDKMWGDSGSDTFVFAGNFAADTIKDYEKGIDRLELDDALWTGTLTAQQVVFQYATDIGSDILFDFGNGETILLEGVLSRAGLYLDIDIV